MLTNTHWKLGEDVGNPLGTFEEHIENNNNPTPPTFPQKK
jgi:hypothetical protein